MGSLFAAGRVCQHVSEQLDCRRQIKVPENPEFEVRREASRSFSWEYFWSPRRRKGLMITVIDIQSVALDRARGDIFVVELRFESSLAYRSSPDMGSASSMSHSIGPA